MDEEKIKEILEENAKLKEDIPWYENLNNFLVVEWDRLQESEDSESQFTDEEEDMITSEAMQILLDNLNIDEDEFEDHEQDIDWRRFDDIIGHYICDV